MSSLLNVLSNQALGRPEKKCREQTVFKKQMAELNKENALLEQKLILKDLPFDLRIRQKDRKKNK